MSNNLVIRFERAIEALFGHEFLIQYEKVGPDGASGGSMVKTKRLAAIKEALAIQKEGYSVKVCKRHPNGERTEIILPHRSVKQ